MDVDIRRAMRRADFRRIDVGEPVVRRDLARDVQNEPAQRVALIGIGVYAPVLLLEVLVDGGGDIDQRAPVLAQPLVLLAVSDVGTRGLYEPRGDQGLLGAILDRLDRRRAAPQWTGRIRRSLRPRAPGRTRSLPVGMVRRRRSAS